MGAVLLISTTYFHGYHLMHRVIVHILFSFILFFLFYTMRLQTANRPLLKFEITLGEGTLNFCL